jgi:hypothetical protein
MTETIAHTDGHLPPPIPPKPHTDAAAVKANAAEHKPRLVTSDHVRGSSPLDKIAVRKQGHARQAKRHSGHGAQDPGCRGRRVARNRLTRGIALAADGLWLPSTYR